MHILSFPIGTLSRSGWRSTDREWKNFAIFNTSTASACDVQHLFPG